MLTVLFVMKSCGECRGLHEGTRKGRQGRMREGGGGNVLSQTWQIFAHILHLRGPAIFIIVLSIFILSTDGHTDQECTKHPTLDRRRDVIQSTHYPQPYDMNTCEHWFIQGDQHDTITISFRDLDIPSDDDVNCHGDSYLRMGPKPEVRLCGSLRDQVPEVYISQRNHVWIYFYGSGRILGRGFSLQYVRGRQPFRDRCLQDEFTCGNAKCILARWRCNGADECGDGSDEQNCTGGISRLTTPGPWDCGQRHFGCFESRSEAYRCFMNTKLCDGVKDCHDGGDEKHCDPLHRKCGGTLLDPSGIITSPNFPAGYPANINCRWSIQVTYGERIQLRFRKFILENHNNKDYVSVYDGASDSADVIGTYHNSDQPPSLIESSENYLFIRFHSNKDNNAAGFNATYQTKGKCLLGQLNCGFGEKDCYEESQRCDNTWNCKEHGGDERGCGKCVDDKFLCTVHETQCFSESEHCDGNNHCRSGRDEEMCTPTQCGPHNGTFLCNNHHCIFESWCCDGTDDCQDGSDELHCSRPSVKVITAAVIGSLICGLLLVIALGCTCKLYALRLHEAHANLRYSTPISRMTEEIFARRLAPPPYNEAMLTSRPFEEAYQDYIEQIQRVRSQRSQGRRSRHSRSNQGRSVNSQGQNQGLHDEVSSQANTDADDVPLLNISDSGNNASDDIPVSLSSDCEGDDSDSNFDPTDNSNVNISLATGMSAQWRRTRRSKRSDSDSSHLLRGQRSDSVGQDSRDGASLETASASTDSVVISLDEGNTKAEDDVPLLPSNPELLLGSQSNTMHPHENGSDGESERSGSVDIVDVENAIITAEVHSDTRPLLDR